MKPTGLFPLIVAITFAFASSSSAMAQNPSATDWPTYGNDPGGQRYSPLDQINKQNVAQLKVAWTYHTGDVSDGSDGRRWSAFENTPIVIDGTMYISTPFSRVIALDPVTGKEKWSYDPKIDLQSFYAEGLINRGVSSWLDPARAAHQPCRRRIYIGTIDARLISLDAASGHTCADFGVDGQINLKTTGANIQTVYNGEYAVTSPPAVIDDLVIVGSAIGDNTRAHEPSGLVRAFDARTGALRWSWYPIPQGASDPASKTWAPGSKSGAANVWSIISTDLQNDLVYLPVSSASPDYYGGLRLGNDIYSDSLVALHAKTGQLAWHFQTTHHDLWDYDNPAMPLLCTIRKDGKEIPAVVQGTKRGSLFIFNRITGEPVYPIEERPVPQTDVAGEQTSPTQPFPMLPPLIIPVKISADDAWGVLFFDRLYCHYRMAGLRAEGIFTPPSINGSMQIPSNAGGMNWSGAAFDPRRQVLVTNTNNLVSEVHLIPRAEFKAKANSMTRGFGVEYTGQYGTPYGMSRVIMRSIFPGLMCNPPPWGSLTGVNLSTGQIKWSVPLGNLLHGSHIFSDHHWGSPNFGGAIVTAGGLTFIGASVDPYLRAFDTDTGRELWETELPAGGNATPMTYRGTNGKQYVVIAAGGHGGLGSKLGDSLVAFTLP
jgi:quinoprotein glucose dehydrogenase